jgi:CHAT domain-containing protein
VAFVLPAGAPDKVRMVDLGEAEPIDLMIATYRNHLIEAARPGRSPGASTRAGADLGSALRAVLFDPVANVLDAACNHWLLAPDDALSQLPFEVLPRDTGGYLTDTVQITCLSAGRDVLRFDTATQVVPTAALVVADPDFDLAGVGSALASPSPRSSRHSRDLKRGGLQFVDRLSGTAVEGARIAALLGVTPWLAETVLETPLKAAHSPCILHLATHGGFLPDQPFDANDQAHGPELGRENPMLRSFLVLAGFNTWFQGGDVPAEAEDGMLTAEDVSGMNLMATELVVLSACETGRGAIQTGEGVMGLRRAFVLAGAQTLVMSLWSVSDMATAVLMERFYTNLIQGQGRSAALRHAQDALRRMTVAELRKDWLSPEMIERLAAGDPARKQALEEMASRPDADCPFNLPFFWGAFICQGVPTPLRSTSLHR